MIACICESRVVGGADLRRWICTALIALVLGACGGNEYRAPVEDRRVRPQPGTYTVPGSYNVQRGDTLFSIAWRYGLDYRAVAANNRIPAPYTIYPGQRIYLAHKAPAPAKKPAAPAKAGSTVAATTKPASTSTTGRQAPAPAPKPVPAKPKATASSNKPVSTWRWPTNGTVTRGFSNTVHKGIDINGKRGDAIYAVAAGRVVYAGTGIVGYGELVIVKHNDVYLSAYGHNSRLLVDEGDSVKAGEKIAEKGSSGTDTVKLHFEIRKEGKPVDPKKLLPTR